MTHVRSKWYCPCVSCRAFRASHKSKAVRLERVAAEMREKYGKRAILIPTQQGESACNQA